MIMITRCLFMLALLILQQSACSDDEEELLKIIKETAQLDSSRTNTVVPVFSNYAWVDMAHNFILQAKAAGMNNYFVYGWDEHTCAYFKAIGERCFFKTAAGGTENSASWGTKQYFNMIDSRLYVVLQIIEHGYSSFLLDTDSILLDDPMKYVDRKLVLQYQQEMPPMKPGGVTLNGGCWKLSAGSVSADFLKDAIEIMRVMEVPDQDALNIAMDHHKDLKHGPFSAEKFPNGFAYYFMNVPQKQRVTPVFIHANWITGKAGKQFRIRDAGAWLLPSEEKSNKLYITYENAADFDVEHHQRALKFALAVAEETGRSLILPKVYCYYSESMPHCNIDAFFDLSRLLETFDCADLSLLDRLTDYKHVHLSQAVDKKYKDTSLLIIKDMPHFVHSGFRHHVSDDLQMRIDEAVQYSFLIVNDLRTTMQYLSRDSSPYFCLLSEPEASRAEELKSKLTSLKDASKANMYALSGDMTSKTEKALRKYRKIWPGNNVFYAWDLLWFGLKQLEGNQVEAWVQIEACKQAEAVIITTTSDDNIPKWIIPRLCKSEESASCIYL